MSILTTGFDVRRCNGILSLCNVDGVDAASLEYFKAIDRSSLDADVVTPQFKDMKNGQYKMISFYAKKARGMMARFIIQNRIESVNDILSFDLGGYSYNASLSLPNQPVFTRSQS